MAAEGLASKKKKYVRILGGGGGGLKGHMRAQGKTSVVGFCSNYTKNEVTYLLENSLTENFIFCAVIYFMETLTHFVPMFPFNTP